MPTSTAPSTPPPPSTKATGPSTIRPSFHEQIKTIRGYAGSARDGVTPEARLVKACDKLQLMLKVAVYERWGTGALAEFWDNPDNFPDGGFAVVQELFEELRQRRSQ